MWGRLRRSLCLLIAVAPMHGSRRSDPSRDPVPLFINDAVRIKHVGDIGAGNANDRNLHVGRLAWLESVA
jgi:hypothetical protein